VYGFTSMTAGRLAFWFALTAALAAYSRADIRARRHERCALDGSAIAPVRRVDLMRDAHVLRSFCSITCARRWPDVPAAAYWRVHDEVTGRAIDARLARFVESRVVTVPARHERTHVFAHWADAKAHAETHGGREIENPLAAIRPAAPSPKEVSR
jgi:hypothetical protein